MNYIEQKLISYIRKNELIKEKDSILILLSGGADSVFLLHILNKFKKLLNIKLNAFHLNHMLRQDAADDDEKFCETLCKDLNIPFFNKKVDVSKFAKKEKISVEEAGRIIRYQEAEKIITNNKINRIVTGHHQDDLVETVLLNFIKGSGIDGLSGIPVKRGDIIRPLLCLKKSEITEYLEQNNIEFKIDETNYDSGFERNFLRNEVIDIISQRLNPNFTESIVRLSETTSLFKNFRNAVLEEKAKTLISIKDEERKEISFNIKLLKKEDPFIQREIFRYIIKKEFQHETEFRDVEKFISFYEKQKGKKIEFSRKVKGTKEADEIVLHRGGKKKKSNDKELIIYLGEKLKFEKGNLQIVEASKDEIIFGESQNIEFISGDKLSEKFTLRKWKEGDYFSPLGMKGEKNISSFLTDLKIPSSQKKNIYVLLNKNKIVWVVGFRIDNKYKINNKTEKVYKLCLN